MNPRCTHPQIDHAEYSWIDEASTHILLLTKQPISPQWFTDHLAQHMQTIWWFKKRINKEYAFDASLCTSPRLLNSVFLSPKNPSIWTLNFTCRFGAYLTKANQYHNHNYSSICIPKNINHPRLWKKLICACTLKKCEKKNVIALTSAGCGGCLLGCCQE